MSRLLINRSHSPAAHQLRRLVDPDLAAIAQAYWDATPQPVVDFPPGANVRWVHPDEDEMDVVGPAERVIAELGQEVKVVPDPELASCVPAGCTYVLAEKPADNNWPFGKREESTYPTPDVPVLVLTKAHAAKVNRIPRRGVRGQLANDP